MSKKVLALSIILLLTTISFTSMSLVQAATDKDGEWITDYTIEDAGTGQILVTHDAAANKTTSLGAVVPGIEVKITFTVVVIASGEGNLKLTTALLKPASGPYWEYDDAYDLGSTFSPNTASTTFNWEAGEFQMTVYGRVPSSSGSTAKAVNAVTLAGPSGTSLDKLVITATTAEMDNFLTLLTQKEDHLDEMRSDGVDVGFTDMYENVLAIASDVAYGGDVENAIALLNGLDVTEPAGSTMQMLFYPLVGVTAAIAVIFLVLFLRIRGKVSYMQLVVEDQVKDLEGLTLRASKIDRAMSANLDSVKDRLKHLVGM